MLRQTPVVLLYGQTYLESITEVIIFPRRKQNLRINIIRVTMYAILLSLFSLSSRFFTSTGKFNSLAAFVRKILIHFY